MYPSLEITHTHLFGVTDIRKKAPELGTGVAKNFERYGLTIHHEIRRDRSSLLEVFLVRDDIN